MAALGISSKVYAGESLTYLLRAIVAYSDTAALEELLERRPLFGRTGGPPQLLTQFLATMREGCSRGGDALAGEIADWSYDQVLAEFTTIPRSAGGMKEIGPDCRLYCGAVLRLCDKWRREHPDADALEEEATAAQFLQGLAVKHFHLARHDFYRRPEAPTRRYMWAVEGGHLTLWRPAHISCRGLRQWLETHFPDADSQRPGERERIQAEIDRAFPQVKVVLLDADDSESLVKSNSPSPLAVILRSEAEEEGIQRLSRLVDLVSLEKLEHMAKLRPAIRSLGSERLQQMIVRIFTDLTAKKYQDGAIVREFGLSKVTFSRFAGSRWCEDGNGLELFGYPSGELKLTTETIPLFPELAGASEEVLSRERRKWMTSLHEQSPALISDYILRVKDFVKYLIQRAADGHTRWHPISPANVFRRLLTATDYLEEVPIMAQNLAVTEALIQQSHCCIAEIGTDPAVLVDVFTSR